MELIFRIYLDWVNNFLTVESFAKHYGLSVPDATELIAISRRAYNLNNEVI